MVNNPTTCRTMITFEIRKADSGGGVKVLTYGPPRRFHPIQSFGLRKIPSRPERESERANQGCPCQVTSTGRFASQYRRPSHREGVNYFNKMQGGGKALFSR
jgi:hypothetical protein